MRLHAASVCTGRCGRHAGVRDNRTEQLRSARTMFHIENPVRRAAAEISSQTTKRDHATKLLSVLHGLPWYSASPQHWRSPLNMLGRPGAGRFWRSTAEKIRTLPQIIPVQKTYSHTAGRQRRPGSRPVHFAIMLHWSLVAGRWSPVAGCRLPVAGLGAFLRRKPAESKAPASVAKQQVRRLTSVIRAGDEADASTLKLRCPMAQALPQQPSSIFEVAPISRPSRIRARGGVSLTNHREHYALGRHTSFSVASINTN